MTVILLLSQTETVIFIACTRKSLTQPHAVYNDNQLANIAAKLSLSSISCFSFSGEADLLSSLPASIVDVAFKNQSFNDLSL